MRERFTKSKLREEEQEREYKIVLNKEHWNVIDNYLAGIFKGKMYNLLEVQILFITCVR